MSFAPFQLPEHLKPVLLDAPHPASLDHDTILAQCSMNRGRSSGPGGQHRNKVQTLVEYTHTPTGIMAAAGERRSAAENARVALTRLRLTLACKVRVPAGVPSELWASRCAKGKIRCSTSHQDFPAMLAEALDHVFACGLDQKAAAGRLECSATQLVRFANAHPPAMQWWNDARQHRGMRPLRP